MEQMKTLIIGNKQFEIVDAIAREELNNLKQSGLDSIPPEVIEQAIADYMEQNGVQGGSSARIGEVTLTASGWIGDKSPYSQVVNIAGATKNDQVDLTPSIDQLAVFYEKDLTFVTENEDGVITVYAIGQKPQNDYTIQCTLTEVYYE